MDSTQIASNICNTTRLRLLVEVLQRTHRMLDDADQEHYADVYAPYLKGKAGQYAYRVKADESGTHLERIGGLMDKLVVELAAKYGDEHSYSDLENEFSKNTSYWKTERWSASETGSRIECQQSAIA